MCLPLLEQLSLWEDASGFYWPTSATIGVVQTALTCCPLLLRLTGAFFLDHCYIPETPIGTRHRNIQSIDLCYPYFKVHHRIEPPEEWGTANRRVSQLLGGSPFRHCYPAPKWHVERQRSCPTVPHLESMLRESFPGGG
jgi:hypothetical protein